MFLLNRAAQKGADIAQDRSLLGLIIGGVRDITIDDSTGDSQVDGCAAPDRHHLDVLTRVGMGLFECRSVHVLLDRDRHLLQRTKRPEADADRGVVRDLAVFDSVQRRCAFADFVFPQKGFVQAQEAQVAVEPVCYRFLDYGVQIEPSSVETARSPR